MQVAKWSAINNQLQYSSTNKKLIMSAKPSKCLNGRFVYKNTKQEKYFIQDIYIQENLTLFIGITSHLKQSSALRSKICIWEPPVQETVYVYDREWCMNMQVFNVHMHAHVLLYNVCVYRHLYTLTQVAAQHLKWISKIIV